MTEHVAVPEREADEKGPVATGQTITVKGKEGLTVDLPEFSETLTFTVPKDAPQEDLRGKKIEKAYTFGQVASEAQANDVMTAKGWLLVDFVNAALQDASRSSAYQATLALYRPSKVSEDDIVDRMVRDYIRLGVSEEAARAQVLSMLGNK